jgi:hypothetical protein
MTSLEAEYMLEQEGKAKLLAELKSCDNCAEARYEGALNIQQLLLISRKHVCVFSNP